MHKALIFATSAILALSSVNAEEWSGIVRKHPANKPVTNAHKISEKLDFLVFMSKIDGEHNVTVRVRNGKHKQGAATIEVDLENASIVVQRIEINLPLSVMESQKDGQHFMDTFKYEGKLHAIYYNIENGKFNQTITIKNK